MHAAGEEVGGHEQPVGAGRDLGLPDLPGELGRRRVLHDQRRYAEAPGVLERLAAQGAGGDGVDEVRLEARQRLAHLAAGPVERADARDLAASVGRQAGTGRHQQHLVPGVDEVVGQLLERGGGAVDGGVERLGHQGDPTGVHGDSLPRPGASVWVRQVNGGSTPGEASGRRRERYPTGPRP